ncbi:MAG: AMP-binding protein [Acidimicrobiia bacterium]|nr:AMP-binding protein [Acidimicrobiia bacterium]
MNSGNPRLTPPAESPAVSGAGDGQTFLDALGRAMTIAADREALICGDRRRTYRALKRRIEQLHAVLHDAGIRRGERVAIISANSDAMVELYCGLPMAGFVQVPLNFRWADPELAYALEDSGAQVLVCDRDPGALRGRVERVIRIDDGEYDTLLSGATPRPFDDVELTESDVAGLFYTGGTTGASKGVALTHRNLVANASNINAIQPMGGADRYLLMAPLFHAAGSVSVLQSIFAGATQVVLPAFDPAAMLELIETERITHTLGVPAMVAATVEEQLLRPRDVSSLEVYGHGGSPIALEVVRRGVTAFPGVQFVHVYGATETSPIISGLTNEVDLLDVPRGRSAGQPALGCQVVIRRPDGTPADTDEPGEVTVRGPNVMAGYWNKPGQTEAALRAGWYWSGDVGSMDDGGFLFILDRSKDMIISGGENVYCTEVEDAIYTHPAVLEATVFGVPDEQWGEAVHAVVVRRDGNDAIDADALMEHCRAHIAGYKIPRKIDFRTDPLPKSSAGKVLKRELRDPYWAGRDRSIG